MSVYFNSSHIDETLVGSVKQVVISPQGFFSGMPKTETYRDSLVFLAIVLVVLAIGISLVTSLAALPVMLATALALGIVTTWLWAWYLGWACRVFCRVQLSTANAFQICAYSSVPLVFSWLPHVGILASLWNLYLNWQGLVSHARVRGGSALMVILVPMVVLAISMAILAALLFTLMTDMGMEPTQLLNSGDVEMF